MEYLLAGQTKQGKRKKVNQDSVLLARDMFCGRPGVLAVVCDGMGGFESGEIASCEAAALFSAWFEKELRTVAAQDEFEDGLYDSWENLLQNMHKKIRGYGSARGIRIGTTATAMLFLGGEYYIAHVGDTRVYEITDRAVQLTRDQTASRFSTKLKKEESRASGALLQGVGASMRIHPVYTSGTVRNNAVYLLCSDGFRHRLDNTELEKWFMPGCMSDEDVMKSRLAFAVDKAAQRGERDDISAVLVRVCEGA